MQSFSEKRQALLQRKKQQIAAFVTLVRENEMAAEADDGVESPEPNPKRFRLSDEQVKEFKEVKRLIDKRASSMPKFRLRNHGDLALLSIDMELRIPIFLTDVQHLIMSSQLGQASAYSPARWCQLEKYDSLQSTNVFIIENISVYHYESYGSSFPFITENFNYKLEMLTPKLYSGDSVQELATVSLTATQMRKYVALHGSMDIAAEICPNIFNFAKNIFPVIASTNNASNITNEDKFPRTDILLSGWQMVEECFPLPIKGVWERKYKGYVLTSDEYTDVTPSSPMFGLDCEMCLTTAKESELTRVSIVDENYKTIYDELVLPDNKIIDYVTRYSGITAKMMKNVTKKLWDVQMDIRRLLPPDAIIVGQSVNNDLHALKMMHPYIIDTSIIYNITGQRSRKTKLQTLSMEFLSERIQVSKSGHCSTEDSIASLKLAKLKLSKDIYFGDAVMSNIQPQMKHHSDLGSASYATSMLRQIAKKKKKPFVVTIDELALKYNYFTNKTSKANKIQIHKGTENEEVVQKLLDKCKSEFELLIGHIKLTDHDLCNNKDTFAKVDEWIKQIHEASHTQSLNIVVFAGGKETGNGCCFINMKT